MEYKIFVASSKQLADDNYGCSFAFENEEDLLAFLKIILKQGLYFELIERV